MKDLKNLFKMVTLIVIIINVLLIGFLLWPVISFAIGNIVEVSNFLPIPILLGSIDSIHLVFTIAYLIIRSKKN